MNLIPLFCTMFKILEDNLESQRFPFSSHSAESPGVLSSSVILPTISQTPGHPGHSLNMHNDNFSFTEFGILITSKNNMELCYVFPHYEQRLSSAIIVLDQDYHRSTVPCCFATVLTYICKIGLYIFL